MSEFQRTHWQEADFTKDYINNADLYLLERTRTIEIMKSFYTHFIKNKVKNKPINILDLGCGDGRLTHELLKVDQEIKAVLIDGSTDMLSNAKKRLHAFENIIFIHSSFQEIKYIDLPFSDFDFIISSLAIHHLTMQEKNSLFKFIYKLLKTDGCFLNIDVVLSKDEPLEQWYLELWKEWIIEKEKESANYTSFQYIPEQYKNNSDNIPDTLDDQINCLKSIGFKDADCYYKYGIFSIFGGRK